MFQPVKCYGFGIRKDPSSIWAIERVRQPVAFDRLIIYKPDVAGNDTRSFLCKKKPRVTGHAVFLGLLDGAIGNQDIRKRI